MREWKKRPVMMVAGPTIPITVMSKADQMARRAELENEIANGARDGLAVKIRVGKALRELGPGGSAFYRWTHATWKDYCEQVLGIKERTASNLMNDWAAALAIQERCKDGDNSGTVVAGILPMLTDEPAMRELGKHREYKAAILEKMEADKEPPTKEAIRRVAKIVKPPPRIVPRPQKIVDKKRRKIGQRVMYNLRMVYRGLQDAGLIEPFEKRLTGLAKEIEAAFLEVVA